MKQYCRYCNYLTTGNGIIKTHYAEYEYERLLYEYIIEKIDVLIKDLQEFAGEESED